MIPTIFTFNKEPRLTLVGAGPGDPELLTVKAVSALKNADIVLFDALISNEILNLIPEGIPSLAVGKRAGKHSYSQDSINELIVEMAYLHGHVVRLKGGDPFVFGRGSEEVEYAEGHGLQVSVVPGISSSIAVPSSCNIPVTARGVSESFWVVTGTTQTGEISPDMALAAQSKATVIILMGLNKIEHIMDLFKQYGKHELPVAIIQNGTLSTQRFVSGTVSNICAIAKMEDISSPAVIVVGEVVRFAHELDKISANILKGYQ